MEKLADLLSSNYDEEQISLPNFRIVLSYEIITK